MGVQGVRGREKVRDDILLVRKNEAQARFSSYMDQIIWRLSDRLRRRCRRMITASSAVSLVDR